MCLCGYVGVCKILSVVRCDHNVREPRMKFFSFVSHWLLQTHERRNNFTGEIMKTGGVVKFQEKCLRMNRMSFRIRKESYSTEN